MAEIHAKVIDQKGAPVLGADIVLAWKNWLGEGQEAKGRTDSNGEEKMSIGVVQTTVDVTASKSGSRDKKTVFVNLIGGLEPPNPQQFQLVFDPLGGAGDAIGDFYKDIQKFISEKATLLIIFVGIPLGIASAYFIYKWVSTGQFIGTARSVRKALPVRK